MNELIERLAEQCYEHDQSWTGVGQRIFNKEKFAQLIIEECCSSIRLEDAYNGGRFQRIILEHFGVK